MKKPEEKKDEYFSWEFWVGSLLKNKNTIKINWPYDPILSVKKSGTKDTTLVHESQQLLNSHSEDHCDS